MSKEGDRATVFRTIQVRTKLKGDNSWMQSRNDPEPETQEEKPWMAEVRARSLNEDPIETSPVSSPTKPTTEKAPTSGYMIRGVFTKTDSKPATSSTSNGFSGTTTNLNKKPSDSYKKIAPHTVRQSSESPDQTDGQLSPEEQEKRTEAASNVLKTSAVRQRSYVLSAAKKYETSEKAPDSTVVNSSPSFVAKRVEIIDDDEPAESPASASPPPSSPAVPVTPPAAAPEPTTDTKVETSVEASVYEPVAPTVEDVPPEPVKEAPPLVSLIDDPPLVTLDQDPFEHMKPGCTKVATPLPVLLPEYVVEVCNAPEPKESKVSWKDDAPQPLSPAPVSPVPGVTVKAEPEPKEEPEPEPEPEPSPNQSSGVDALTALSDSLISFNTSPTSLLDTQVQSDENNDTQEENEPIAPIPDSFRDAEPVPAEEDADNPTEDSVEREPAPGPALSNCVEITDDLLALSDGPEELAEPIPPSPGRWSQDLLSGPFSLSDPMQTSGALDLLADDVIPINTETRSLSGKREEERQTDETARDTQSPTTETVTITTKTVISTEKSSTEDNTDPWSSHTTTTTVTESSSSDLLLPVSTQSINSSADRMSPTDLEKEDPSSEISMSGDALDDLADDIIPIDTNTKSLSTHRSWAHTWETHPSEVTNAESSREEVPAGRAEDQQTLVTFERKSAENDSPWDKWTSPTVYSTTNTTTEEKEEEKEEEESPEDPETQTVTTVTTIRETYSDPEPAMDRYESYSSTLEREEDQSTQTPEAKSKKGVVLVREYVNAAELSQHNARDNSRSGSDDLTSSSSSYTNSSPSSYSRGSIYSPCTYCGELVGNDAKITIEHLNINCHPACFKCGVCSKPMGDLLYNMFLHGGTVHCEGCYNDVCD